MYERSTYNIQHKIQYFHICFPLGLTREKLEEMKKNLVEIIDIHQKIFEKVKEVYGEADKSLSSGTISCDLCEYPCPDCFTACTDDFIAIIIDAYAFTDCKIFTVVVGIIRKKYLLQILGKRI